jgi:23S rRNA (uracil1939-C5)-methyltransferase
MLLTETSRLGPLRVPLASFYQVNSAVADRIVERVSALVAQLVPEVVIDVFCGVGLFALAARRLCVPKVFGIDSDTRAIEAARANAAELGLEPVSFLCAGAEQGMAEVSSAIRSGRSLLIVDPPRRGLEGPTLEAVARLAPAHLVYVSCAADTLARDIVRFSRAGYRVENVELFDLFPRTAHFESVTLLSR